MSLRQKTSLLIGSALIILIGVFAVGARAMYLHGRNIYHHGGVGFWYFMLAVAGSGLVFGILTLWFLERQVISRLSLLNSSVLKIARSEGVSERIELSGNDELNRLAENINEMLAAKQETEAHYRILFQESKDAAYFTNREGRVMICNQAALDMFGYDKTEMLELDVVDIYADPEERKRLIRELVSSESVEDYEVRFRRKDGTKMTGLISASVRWADDGTLIGFQGVIRDVTKLKHREERLVHLATHDSLTDLPNRYLLNDRLAQAISRAKRNGWTLGILWLDLDHFKDINDSLGHDMGDKVLQGFSARLISILRASDTVARIGGDEFVILLPEISNVNDGEVVAKKVIDAIRKPFRADGHELFITISIGIAVYPQDGDIADTLLQHADMAMYQAKRKGRDNYARFEASQDRTAPV